MRWRFIVLLVSLALGATIVEAMNVSAARGSSTFVRVTSGTPGHEVPPRGVVLVLGEPMQVVTQTTPYEVHSESRLVFAAFEAAGPEAMLRLELTSDEPEPAVVTAPRVMVGRRIGGVATEFVQDY